ncbi:MAG: phosphodiester glycosidase family protein [Acutalibacteraceae bacterium]
MTSSTRYNVAPGIVEEHITTVDTNGNNQNKSYVAIFDFSSGLVSAMAGYKDYDTSGKWGMQTVRDQARKAELATGRNIVVAINADYYNMSTGEPLNNLVMGGKIVHLATDPNSYYFAVLKDGTPVIRKSSEPLDDVQEAVGSPFPLVIDGNVNEDLRYDTSQMPRNAIGIDADGKVIIMVNDGRQAPKSVGYTSYEIAKMMKAYGCVNAIYLDGGGSATFASKSEGTNALTVKNSPSDGNERLVSDTILFYSTAVATGEFDHASLSPNNEVYTPSSTVSFSAIGVDSVGSTASLPENGIFALADDSYGSITEAGVFTPSGKTGTVTVNYVCDGDIKGTTSIEIETPDSITFAQDEVSLGFETRSDLGLIVKNKNRVLNYTAEDIKWTVSDDTMGSFDGLTFISSDSATITGTITASSKYDESVKGTVTAVIGKLPAVMMDFEAVEDEDGNLIPAKDYWTVTKGTCAPDGGIISCDDDSAKLLTTNYSRGGVNSAEIVGIDDGEVRFGSNALKINFDFSGNVTGTEGANVGLVNATTAIEGSPTGIGLWVYAPENCPNLWLRIRVKDGTGTTQTIDFEDTNGKTDINWTGWRYMEASLIKNKETGEVKFPGPYSLIGGETIRVMYLINSNGNFTYNANGEKVPLAKADQKGYIYVDNLQFVYGANTDDIDNPVVNNIQANLKDLSNGDIIDTNDVSFRISYSDVQNKNTTGINTDSLAVYIDGKNMTDDCVIQAGDEMIYLDGLKLANGDHSIKVRVRDNFNNETIETKTFRVEGSENLNTVYAVGSEKAVLGKTYSIKLTAQDISKINSMSAMLKIDSAFADGYTYEFAEGYEGSCAFDAKTTVFNISAEKSDPEAEISADYIAKINLNIPIDTPESKSVTYSLSDGVFDCEGEYQKTFSSSTVSTLVTADISVSVGNMIVGSDGGKITVSDAEGNAVENAEIYNNGTMIGLTDKNGELITDALTDSVKTYKISAVAGEDYSFSVSGQSLTPAPVDTNAPQQISISATKDSETTKNITWLSNPIKSGSENIVLCAEKSEYEKNGFAAFKTFKANTTLYPFVGSSDINNNYIANINSCVVTGLKRDTEYVYKVGDGEVFSKLKSFKTYVNGTNVNFFVIGDTQTEDKVNQDKIFDNLANDDVNYSFGIQTGDSIESANVYGDWLDNLALYSGDYMSAVDIVHVLGNHEYMGDVNADAASAIYNLQNTDVYSVQYGNVYIATMSYSTNSEEIAQRLEWIKEDSAKSNAIWKILTIHQPPYYTNVTSPSTVMNELIPPAMKEAGFDFVFSGHDHTYARTAELDGTVYYICGTTGGKSYGLTDKTFDFAEATDDFDHEGYKGIYLTCSATEKDFTVTARYANGDIFDEYVKTKEICENSIHTFTYTSDGYLTCSVCGYTVKADESNHTGMIKDAETGVAMYLISGVPQTSRWITNGDDYYYLGTDGKALTGVQEVTDADGVTRTYTFDETGLNIAGSFVEEEVTNPADGETRTITRYYFGGTYLRRWHEIDGSTYYFYRTNNAEPVYNEGEMFTGTKTVKTSQKNTVRTFVFSEDGKLLVGALEDETDIDGNYTGTRYYWGDNYMTDTTVDVNGFEYILDENGYVTNKTDFELCEVTLSATSGNYTGSAKKPGVTVKLGDKVLIKDQHYTVSYENNKEVGTASVIVTGCKSVIGSKTLSYTIKPSKPTELTSKVSGTSVVLTWTASKGASDYTVYRSTSLNGSYSKIATVSGKTTYTDKTASPATTYYYKVRAYKDVDGKTYNSSYSDAVSSKLPLGNVSGLKATATAYNKVKLTFSAVDGATGYAIYRSTSKDGKYSRIGTASKASYTDATVKTGTKYYYKVRAFKTEGTSTKYSAYTSVVSAKPALSAVTGLKVSSTAYNKVTLKWTAVSGATSYAVYRSTSKNGTYTRIGTAAKNSFSDTSVKTGTKYYYKVRAIIKVDKTNVYSAYSSVVSATPALAKATVKSVTASGKTVNIKWSKVSGASGYIVYQASSKTGSLKKIKTVKSGSTTAFAAKVSKSGTYYYVVKAYRTVGSKNVYGAASSRVSVKVR